MSGYVPSREVYESSTLILLEERYQYPFRLGFIGLIMFADSKGKFRWDTSKLEERVLPITTNVTLSVEEFLNILRSHHFIIQYSQQENMYGFIRNFSSYIIKKEWIEDQSIPYPKVEKRLKKTEKEQLLTMGFLSSKSNIYDDLVSKLCTGCPQNERIKANNEKFIGLEKSLGSQYCIIINILYIIYNLDLDLDLDLILDLLLKIESRKDKGTCFGKNEKNTEAKETSKIANELFENWWKIYPKKLEKAQCKQQFLKLKPTEELTQKLIDAVQAQLTEREMKLRFGLFCEDWIYPIRWLKRKRWEDEVFVTEAHWRVVAANGVKKEKPVRPQPPMYEPKEIVREPKSEQTEQVIESIRKILK